MLVDSSDFNSRATQGSWSHTQAEEQYGYDTYSHPAGDGTSSFSWQLHIPRNGTCEVFVRHQIDAPQGPWSLGDRISEAQGLLSDTMRGATGKLKDKTWVGAVNTRTGEVAVTCSGGATAPRSTSWWAPAGRSTRPSSPGPWSG